MIVQSFFLCLLTILGSGILQSPRVLIHSIWKRVLGTLVFALVFIPFLFAPSFSPPKIFGFEFHYQPQAMGLALFLSVAVATMNGFTAGNKMNLAIYPQIRNPIWGIKLVIQSAFAWIAYLVIYEIIFRGVFFYASIALIGFWPATFLNIAVYSLAHLLKNKREALLSIPFGFLMIYITWIADSCWYAVLVHVVLALSHEWSSIHSNPEMRFDFSLHTNKKL